MSVWLYPGLSDSLGTIHKYSDLAPSPFREIPGMSSENYFNHPTFGLLVSICSLGGNRELFTTLYAQRLFFLVEQGATGMAVEALSRDDARSLVEIQMRTLRRSGRTEDYKEIQKVYRRTFQ